MKEILETMDVFGDYAMVTSPSFKVERFSYPILTPSATRAIFEAVFFKRTKFAWRPTKVEILEHPEYPGLPYPSYMAMRSNEVTQKVSNLKVKQAMKAGKAPPMIVPDNCRTQRMSMLLKAPRFRIHALLRPWPEYAGEIKVLHEQFQRRLSRGQCFHQPFFGCRECVAFFEKPTGDRPLPVSLDIGLMLYDVFDLSTIGRIGGGEVRVSMFEAKVQDGVMDIPPFESDEVRKGIKFTRWGNKEGAK